MSNAKINSKSIKTFDGYNLWAKEYDTFKNPMIAMTDLALSQHPLEVQNKAVLELGCGTGRNFSKLSRQGFSSFVGLDGSPGMLEEAQKKNNGSNVSWIHADLFESLPFSENQFDVVLVSLVLEHIKDLKHIFSEVHRVLKNHGTFRILEIHEEITSKGTKAHFQLGGIEYELPSFTHTESEFVELLAEFDFCLSSVTNWYPNQQIIEELPKVKKHFGSAMVLDVNAWKRS